MSTAKLDFLSKSRLRRGVELRWPYLKQDLSAAKRFSPLSGMQKY